MPWITPKTDWQADEIVTEGDMNDIGSNLNTLRSPATQISMVDHATDFSTSSTTFVDVDPDPVTATNQLALEITSTGGALLVSFAGSVGHSAASDTSIYFDLTLDGLRVGGDSGILLVTSRSTEARNASFVYWLEGVAAGTHTIRLQWRTSSGTATLWAGAGTPGGDLHPQFAVREVS